MYMDLFCDKTGTEKRYVQGWLPIVAAAQLAYKRPEEKRSCWKAGLTYLIISKIRLHMEKEAPEDIFRRLFSKIFMVIMTNKQDLFHNIFKYFTICS